MSDLREWLAKAEAKGEVKTLKGVPWDLDIGVISEIVERKIDMPVLVFDEIPGYPPGYRVLLNAIGSMDRFAMTVGFPQGLSTVELVQEWRRRMKEAQLLPPKVVDSGPVMENVDVGEEVNVLKFPAPKWHELDGGRYIGTGDMVITRQPEGGWLNFGTYRVMVHDRNHLGLMIGPGHHGRWQMEKWHAEGKAMPVAIAMGMDPFLFLVSSREVPAGISEYDFAGAIRGEPIDVIKGPITGLPFPAAAEIVIEGFIDPEERWPEGPFGEFTGYYAGGVRPQPVIKVEAVYYRNNPIILGAPPLKPPAVRDRCREVIQAALIWDALEAAGVPDVVGVWGHQYGGLFIVTAVRQRYPGHAKQAARMASQVSASSTLARFSVVVDEDIDVTDMDEVLWAMCTRVDPDRDIEILRECLSTPLDPMIPPEKKSYAAASRVVIDAARPYEWRDRFPEVVASSPELKQRVLSRWGDMLKGIV